MQQHLVHQHLTRVLHAEGNHGQTVADKNHVHAGMVGDMGAGEVMGSDHGYRFVLAVEGLERVDGDGLARTGRGAQG